jgi:hypothetical protein
MVIRPSEKTPIKPNFCLWRSLSDLMMKKGMKKTVVCQYEFFVASCL